MTVLFVVIWIVCAILVYGGYFAYLQGKFSQVATECKVQHQISAAFVGISGPAGLVSALICVLVMHDFLFKYGLKFR